MDTLCERTLSKECVTDHLVCRLGVPVRFVPSQLKYRLHVRIQR